MVSARIFAIEEFSTFDGPGIRTTVFLKGCPLRCAWCHNPEGQSFDYEYMKNPNGCIGCGNCIKHAQTVGGELRLSEKSAAECPRHLIRGSGEEYTARALADRILKNAPILSRAGGGVTFSGGEPLSHLGFINECVSMLGGLSVALQTSGFSSAETFSKALSLMDYVLFDLKLFNEAEHIKYCNATNKSILYNYELLAKSEKQFVTRIPLIPKVTDTEENLRALAEFIIKQGVSYVEVLPYNRFAPSKYISLMREDIPRFEEGEATDSEEVISLFSTYGITARVM